MSVIPTVDQAAAQVAAAESAIDTPELRAAAALEPLLTEAYERIGHRRRTPQDVARDLAATRQRSEEAERRAAERQVDVRLAYARALAAGAVR